MSNATKIDSLIVSHANDAHFPGLCGFGVATEDVKELVDTCTNVLKLVPSDYVTPLLTGREATWALGVLDKFRTHGKFTSNVLDAIKLARRFAEVV